MGDSALLDCDANQSFGFLNYGYQVGDLSLFSIAGSMYAGNLITVRCEIKELQHPTEGEYSKVYYNDITLADIRHAFEFMARNNTIFEAKKPNKYYLPAAGEWMKAVKISCSGDMKFMGEQKYREVAIAYSTLQRALLGQRQRNQS